MEHVRLGYPDAALHEASAAAVARVLEAHELEVEYVPIAADAVAGTVSAAAIDLFASAWLPTTDAPLLASSRMLPLGTLYRPAFIWCVAADGLASIADLAADLAASMDRRILVDGSGPSATLADHVLHAYALDRAGYVVERVSAQAATDWARAADPSRIVPLTRPHDLLHASGLRALEDPIAALGPEQEARLLIRRELRTELDGDLIDELEALTLGNRVVSAMAHVMRSDGLSAEAAADAWQRGKLTPRA